jgi:hypothetical protein
VTIIYKSQISVKLTVFRTGLYTPCALSELALSGSDEMSKNLKKKLSAPPSASASTLAESLKDTCVNQA